MTKNARLLFTSSRPLSWINTAFPFAAGYYMISGRVDATLIVGSLFFLIPYNLLMYGINDVYDYESDLRNPRKGGVEGAVGDVSLGGRVVDIGRGDSFRALDDRVGSPNQRCLMEKIAACGSAYMSSGRSQNLCSTLNP